MYCYAISHEGSKSTQVDSYICIPISFTLLNKDYISSYSLLRWISSFTMWKIFLIQIPTSWVSSSLFAPSSSSLFALSPYSLFALSSSSFFTSSPSSFFAFPSSSIFTFTSSIRSIVISSHFLFFSLSLRVISYGLCRLLLWTTLSRCVLSYVILLGRFFSVLIIFFWVILISIPLLQENNFSVIIVEIITIIWENAFCSPHSSSPSSFIIVATISLFNLG